MGRVYECIGQKANKPFYLEKIRCNIFSAEELVYCVYQHAELIEKEMFSDNLALWLEQECGANALAEDILELNHKNASVGTYAEKLLLQMDLIEPGKKREFLELFPANGGADTFIRKKQRADYFLKKERYFYAMKEYTALLSEPDAAEIFQRAELLHNRGIAKANLFLLDEAEKDFYEAYRLDGKEKHFFLYAAAMRMRMKPGEYLKEISEVAHMKEVTLGLEEEIKAAEDEWANGEGALFVQTKAKKQLEGNAQYENWLQELLVKKKDAYKRSAR
ncbi:MAG: hypothetical protein IKY53_01695 [Lachnospiraceae bacterium]|nr:hypothetical protein [Lachnospiraceae bacterium]